MKPKKTKEQKIKEFEERYADGKVCPICGKNLPLTEFRFKPESMYMSQCVVCNKLVSSISTIQRKLKSDSDYSEKRIDELKKQIRIHELIYEIPCASAFDIVKILKGNMTMDEFYAKVEL